MQTQEFLLEIIDTLRFTEYVDARGVLTIPLCKLEPMLIEMLKQQKG